VYYVFLETKNNAFLQRVAEKICSLIIKKIFKDYEYIKDDDGCFDQDLANKYVDNEGKNLFLINCYLLLGQFCTNKKCCTNHKTVILSDQYPIFRESIEASHKIEQKIYRESNPTERHGRYRMYLRYVNNVLPYLEIEPIETSTDKGHPKYWDEYIKKVKGCINNKADIDAIFYIRAGDTNSDYNRFKADTGLADLNPCDTIRLAL